MLWDIESGAIILSSKLSWLKGRGHATGQLVVRGQRAAHRPAVHRTGPTAKGELLPNVSSAAAEKPWSRWRGKEALRMRNRRTGAPCMFNSLTLSPKYLPQLPFLLSPISHGFSFRCWSPWYSHRGLRDWQTTAKYLETMSSSYISLSKGRREENSWRLDGNNWMS